jgi:hypothetical protein
MNGSRAVPYGDPAPGASAQEPKTSIRELLKDFGRAHAQGDLTAYRYLLMLRFLLGNVVGAATGQGWIGMIFAADTGGYSLAIVAMFAIGMQGWMLRHQDR